jgi:CRP/FNR family transcriptional regulator
MELVKTIEFLGRVSIFRHLERHVLAHLAAQMQLISLPEGPILEENDKVDSLHIISSGAVKVTKSAEGGGPEAVLAILHEGDSFGEIGVIDGLPASAGVTAMQPTECYLLRREVLLGVLEQYPEVARSMLQSLAAMVRNADEWVAHSI